MKYLGYVVWEYELPRLSKYELPKLWYGSMNYPECVVLEYEVPESQGMRYGSMNYPNSVVPRVCGIGV